MISLFDKKALGEKIKMAREWTGLNQTEFGKKIGISKQALSCIERGVYWPGVDTLENIAVVCGLTLNDFSEEFTTDREIAEKRSEYNVITDRERRLVNRFRLLREDQRKAVEILLHIQGAEKKS